MMSITYKTINVNEDQGSITVSFDWFGNGGGTVSTTTENGTAIAGADYVANTATTYFSANENKTVSLTVKIIDDEIAEPTKSFHVIGRNKDGLVYEYTINILDTDTGKLNPDGSITGPLNAGFTAAVNSSLTKGLSYAADAIERVGGSRVLTDVPVPNILTENSLFDAISGNVTEKLFGSFEDYNLVKGATAAAGTLQVVNALQSATAALNEPDGTTTDAIRAGSARFIIGFSSGLLGTIVSENVAGLLVAGGTIAAGPGILALIVGIAAGGVVGYFAEEGGKKFAEFTHLIPKEKELVAGSSGTSEKITTVASTGISVFHPELTVDKAAPDPYWSYNPKTGEFIWLKQPDAAYIQDVASRIGLAEHPTDLVVSGDQVTDHNDVLYGGNGNDVISGGDGNDYLFGQSGKDVLNGGIGNDVLTGGAGNDTINGGIGTNFIDAGDGDDLIIGAQRLDGFDIINGGKGVDTVDYSSSSGSINIALTSSSASTSASNWGAYTSQRFQTGEHSQVDDLANVEIVVGTAFADHIVAFGVGELDGGEGNDTLEGNAGSVLNGGAGSDLVILYTADAKTHADGGAGIDTLLIQPPMSQDAHYIVKADGEGSLQVSLSTASGDQLIAEHFEKVVYQGGGGNESVDASAANLSVLADLGTGADTFAGGSGDDHVSLVGLDPSDVIDGGAGTDTLVISTASSTDNLNLWLSGPDEFHISYSSGRTLRPYAVSGIEKLELHGADNSDAIHAASATGDIVADLGSGADMFLGGTGNDAVALYELTTDDKVSGGVGNDKLVVQHGAATADIFTIDGTTSLSVSLKDGAASSDQPAVLVADTIEGLELHTGAGNDIVRVGATVQVGLTIAGGDGSDDLTGGGGNDTIFGGETSDAQSGGFGSYNPDGNDLLHGGAGNDLLNGGIGNDTLVGGTGDDTLDGGAGIDTADFSDASLGIIVDLSLQSHPFEPVVRQAIGGGLGNDVLFSIENVVAGSGDDVVIGDGNDNFLFGSAGHDVLFGGAGADSLSGGDGADVLRGGIGADVLTGGAGHDVFYFTRGDLADGSVKTIMDGGISTDDLIRIDGGAAYHIAVTPTTDGARIVFDGTSGNIDVKGIGTNPVVVATSTAVADDYRALSADDRADLQITRVDWANSQNYDRYTEINDASGHLARQFGSYDGANGSWDFLYDTANAESTYATRFDYFDAANHRTQEVGSYDNPSSGNTHYIVTYDPTNAQAYTTTTTYYDAQDRPTQVQAFYDGGGSGITTFDADNSQSYSLYTTYYDGQGRATQANGTYDGTNGSFYVQFDADGTRAWQSLTVLYDQANHVTQQWYTMDNGTIVNL